LRRNAGRFGSSDAPSRIDAPQPPVNYRLRGDPGQTCMPYVVTENCIRCKYMDCVNVCPVVCFYEGQNMLVIHPDECIDCGVCEPECQAKAIVSGSNPAASTWISHNARYAAIWPNITIAKVPPSDAGAFDGLPNKLRDYFSEEPGEGDA
jgi:ferredoxin